MALEANILDEIKELRKRVQALERASQIKNVKIPSTGKLVIPIVTSDPPIENGKVVYRSDTSKFRKCQGGTWKNFEDA